MHARNSIVTLFDETKILKQKSKNSRVLFEISQALLTKKVGAEELKKLDASVDIFDYSCAIRSYTIDI